MKKFAMGILLCLISMFSFAKEYKMLIPNGLPTMALASMMEETKEIDGASLRYLLPKANDAMMVEMMKGTPDIAVIPSNLAAQLYQKQGEYKILGTLTSSSFYILGRSPLSELKELKGKKIYAFAKGLTPDIVLKTILKRNQLEKEVDIQYLSSPIEALQMHLKEKNSFVFLTEPMITQAMLKSKDIKILFSMEEEWKKQFPETSGFPQAVVVVKKELLGKDEFLKELEMSLQSSVNFLYNNPRRVEVLAKYGFSFSDETLDPLLKRSGIQWTGIYSFKQKENFEQYYKILEKENPNTIGGRIPEDSIYAK
ncbi:ABC transporter substrate-binding protein [Fusobacterium necrophorum]|uniref:ABC transporter substrate-binding protein n=1 Tax=Fusobacterium necrophorum TaxID=859 RepID=A0A4Q2KUJ3_9FUSO|nr:ABC transporter substrate-binding protein [Fusobacterium necrophorum]RXZ69218.1 ABC transporter substrate-binding protein [Fusobacterium necrophorum]